MNMYWKGVASSLVVIGLGLLVWGATARANDVRRAECVGVMSMSPKSMVQQYESTMNRWLAEGKTEFVSTPAGICAY